jgi:hypothetical protein
VIKKQTILIFGLAALFFICYLCNPLLGAQKDESAAWQDKYKQYITEKGSDFTMYDIDKDGIPELIYLDDDRLSVYTLQNGVITNVFEDNGIKNSYFDLYLQLEPSVCVYSPRDNHEAALYYTVSVGYPLDGIQENSAIDMKEYKITLKDGIYTSDIAAEAYTEYLASGQPPYIKETYSIRGQSVSKYEFVSSNPLGTRLSFIMTREIPDYGWGPALSAIPQYRIKTLLQRYDFAPEFCSYDAVYPNISNPKLNVAYYYFDPRYTAASIENSIMVWYPDNLFDFTVLPESDRPPINLISVNGNFISGAAVFSDEAALYAPLRMVCQRLGYQVDWIEGTAVISDNGEILDRLYTKTDWDGMFINDRIYVPIRYFEKLRCDVQLITEFFKVDRFPDMVIQAVAIERVYDGAFIISPEEAGNRLWEALEESNRYTKGIAEFNGYPVNNLEEGLKNEILEIKKGFSFEDITYQENIGRYYRFLLKGGKYIILMNKYTGEIYRLDLDSRKISP